MYVHTRCECVLISVCVPQCMPRSENNSVALVFPTHLYVGFGGYIKSLGLHSSN